MKSHTKVLPSIMTLADAGYNVDVIASDGYTITFDAARIKGNKDIIVAYKVNENQIAR